MLLAFGAYLNGPYGIRNIYLDILSSASPSAPSYLFTHDLNISFRVQIFQSHSLSFTNTTRTITTPLRSEYISFFFHLQILQVSLCTYLVSFGDDCQIVS